MAFRLTTFDGVTLPTFNSLFDFSTPYLPSNLVNTLNGSIDFYGTRRRIQHSQMFEVEMMTDATSLANASSNVRNIKDLTGRVGWLVRVDTDGTNSRRRMCRLLGVGITPRATERGIQNRLVMRFESNQPFWYSSSLTTHGPTAISSGVNIDLTIAGEEDVLDAILTITASSAVSSVTVEHDKTENSETIVSELDFTGAMALNEVLVLDCGLYTAKLDGVDAYDDFALDSTHNENYWLRFPAGDNDMEITLGSGGATWKLEYYAAYQ